MTAQPIDADAAVGPVEQRLVVDVVGTPVAQGSKKAFVRGGRAVLVEAAPTLPKWRAAVAGAVRARMALTGWSCLDGPISCSLDFFMPRPVSVKRERPCVTPDCDKLTRAVCDGITVGGAWVDDARVVELHVREFYARTLSGVRIVIEPAGESAEHTTRTEQQR